MDPAAERAVDTPWGSMYRSWSEVLAEDPEVFNIDRLAPWMGEQTEGNKYNFNLKVLQLQPVWNAFWGERLAAKAARRAETREDGEEELEKEDQKKLWRRFLTRSNGRPLDKGLIKVFHEICGK